MGSIVEKKVRKNIRINKLIEKGDKLYPEGETAEYILKSIIKDPSIKIVDTKVGAKVISENCMDDKIHDALSLFFDGNNKKKDLNYIFDVIQRIDLEKYAKHKGLKLNLRAKDDIDDFLDELEKRHTGSKFSFAKTIEKLK